MLNRTAVIDIIKKMVKEQGQTAILDPSTYKRFISDYVGSSFKKEANLLKMILDAGCAKIINDMTVNLSDAKIALVKRMDDEQGISPTASAELLDLLGQVLRGDMGKTVLLSSSQQTYETKAVNVKNTAKDLSLLGTKWTYVYKKINAPNAEITFLRDGALIHDKKRYDYKNDSYWKQENDIIEMRLNGYSTHNGILKSNDLILGEASNPSVSWGFEMHRKK